MPPGMSARYGGRPKRGQGSMPAQERPRITIPQTTPADTAQPVKPKMVKRGQMPEKPKPPTAKPGADVAAEDTDMPRADLSAALLKGAALVPQFSGSNTLRGALGGAAVGMEIGDSLASYRRKKEKASLAKDALNMKPSGALQE